MDSFDAVQHGKGFAGVGILQDQMNLARLAPGLFQVGGMVIGNDATISIGGQSGNFQLNVMLPLIAEKLASSGESLSWACEATAATITGLKVNTDLRLASTGSMMNVFTSSASSMICLILAGSGI